MLTLTVILKETLVHRFISEIIKKNKNYVIDS